MTTSGSVFWKRLAVLAYLVDQAFGQEWRQAAQAQVGRIVGEELQRRGWTEASLSQLRKADAGKVQLARRWRAETTVTLPWIAAAPAMGTWTHVANQLSHASLPA